MQKAVVLVVGAGGREHALAWALAHSPRVEQVYIAPGNAGTAWAAVPNRPFAAAARVPISATDTPALIAFAREKQVDLTVVGPEALLAAGIVDEFQAAGLRIFGPTRAATRLESSKAFAKQFMHDQHIPTAQYATFTTYDEARQYLEDWRVSHPDMPLVVKADGLAAGKGVIVCPTIDEAYTALRRIMVTREFGAAGDTVVIEECLQGREVSLMAFSDGRTVVPMPPARDYKRAYDGDLGPNTGGMGAYTPPDDVDAALRAECMRTVLQPAVDGMAAQGTPYVGILYAGLMLTPAGLRVLEFNCRFGDPETQVVLPLLEMSGGETALFDILLACTTGDLDQVQVAWKSGACATVVLAAPGYPRTYPKGFPIYGLEQPADQHVVVFHAGTEHTGKYIVTAGGRVMAVSATGQDLTEALRRAYNHIQHIHFEAMHYRHDIGS
jgi:phosphoribosylamine--glycine ligase